MTPTTALTATATIATATIGGVCFAFSSFVMPGLRRLPARHGIAAMNSINARALTPSFLTAFVGTGVLCAALGVAAASSDLDTTAGRLRAAGAVAATAGFVLTRAFHLPRNEALATVDRHSAGADAAWRRYGREWTAGNHARTALYTTAAALLLGSLRV
jgi:uncharacterized membrane protein